MQHTAWASFLFCCVVHHATAFRCPKLGSPQAGPKLQASLRTGCRRARRSWQALLEALAFRRTPQAAICTLKVASELRLESLKTEEQVPALNMKNWMIPMRMTGRNHTSQLAASHHTFDHNSIKVQYQCSSVNWGFLVPAHAMSCAKVFEIIPAWN